VVKGGQLIISISLDREQPVDSTNREPPLVVHIDRMISLSGWASAYLKRTIKYNKENLQFNINSIERWSDSN